MTSNLIGKFAARVLTGLLPVWGWMGCATPTEPRRPHIYNGGQYYGDALHGEKPAVDLSAQPNGR